MLTRGQLATREALASLGEIELDEYTPTGTAQADRSVVLRLIDEAM